MGKANPDFCIAVNLAPKNVIDPDLVNIVEDILDKWSVPPDHLILEIAEESVAANVDAAIVQFGKLRNRGIRIALDDFGTGNVGIGTLKSLPIDQLKIDKSLVVPIPSNDVDRRIVGSLIQLASAVRTRCCRGRHRRCRYHADLAGDRMFGRRGLSFQSAGSGGRFCQ